MLVVMEAVDLGSGGPDLPANRPKDAGARGEEQCEEEESRVRIQE